MTFCDSVWFQLWICWRCIAQPFIHFFELLFMKNECNSNYSYIWACFSTKPRSSPAVWWTVQKFGWIYQFCGWKPRNKIIKTSYGRGDRENQVTCNSLLPFRHHPLQLSEVLFNSEEMCSALALPPCSIDIVQRCSRTQLWRLRREHFRLVSEGCPGRDFFFSHSHILSMCRILSINSRHFSVRHLPWSVNKP